MLSWIERQWIYRTMDVGDARQEGKKRKRPQRRLVDDMKKDFEMVGVKAECNLDFDVKGL